jgi:cysteine desulfurase
MYYFDYAATHPFTCNKYLIEKLKVEPKENEIFGNPSSSHELGFKSANILKKSREIIGNCLDCHPKEIIFTSGGTESDNMALKGVMLKYKPEEAELITSTIEHPAILNTCKQLEKLGYIVKYVKPSKRGVVNVEDIEQEITDKTKLISIMAVNNEIGTIQPIHEIAKIAHKNNILFHTDAVQSIGAFKLYLSRNPYIDMASFSGHKFGSLKGTGILYKKKRCRIRTFNLWWRTRK